MDHSWPTDSWCLRGRHSDLRVLPTRRLCRPLRESVRLCRWGFGLDGIQSAAAKSRQDWSCLVHIFSSTTSDPVWSGSHWRHWRAASFFDPRPRDLHRRWHVRDDPRHSRRQSVLRGSTSDPEHAAISVTTRLADLGSCIDCQQGGLLQLGSRWYPRPAARPAAVRLECRRPFGFLSEAVRTQNSIASSFVNSIGWEFRSESHSGCAFWPTAVFIEQRVPCWEPAPDIWRGHSTSSAFTVRVILRRSCFKRLLKTHLFNNCFNVAWLTHSQRLCSSAYGDLQICLW